MFWKLLASEIVVSAELRSLWRLWGWILPAPPAPGGTWVLWRLLACGSYVGRCRPSPSLVRTPKPFSALLQGYNSLWFCGHEVSAVGKVQRQNGELLPPHTWFLLFLTLHYCETFVTINGISTDT